jgi:hypothetical protein
MKLKRGVEDANTPVPGNDPPDAQAVAFDATTERR